MRVVTERLSVARLAGQLTGSVQGTADPTFCRLLDSCGVSGTLGLTLPGAGGADAELIATGPASRPYGDFLTALGQIRGGARHGITVAGSVAWTNSGRINGRLTQPSACSDAAPLGERVAVIGERTDGPERDTELTRSHHPPARPGGRITQRVVTEPVG